MNESRLEQYFEKFDQNHDQLRGELLESLPSMSEVKRGQVVYGRIRLMMRTALAAAAVLVVFLGVGLFNGGSAELNPQSAWAAAIEQAGQLRSIHFKMQTFVGNNNNSGLEMWWRRPHDFRMRMNDGTIITGNSQQRCIYKERDNTLSVRPATGPGPEMFIMGDLGKLFASEYSLASEWITKSRIISSEEINYKGEQCLKIVSQMDGNRYQYVQAKKEPHIYEVKRFGTSGDVICHMEVLDVNGTMDDSLFSIDPQGKSIK